MFVNVYTVTLLLGYGGKKKSKTKSNLKKAAVIGATAYGAYQLGKLSGRFSSPGYGYGNRGYGYQQWNSWREVDGFLCRKTEDCNWIDPRLYCQDYELKFTPQVSLSVNHCDQFHWVRIDSFPTSILNLYCSMVGSEVIISVSLENVPAPMVCDGIIMK